MAKGQDRLIGRDVGRFRVEELVGRGGMGAVYRATDTSLGRTVALKVLTDERAADEGFRRRFLQESKTLASVDHPNIVPVFEAGEAEGELYIAMRFVRGPDLSKLIATGGGLSPAASAAIVAQVADALDAAHAVGLIHRDVKPANILVVAGSAPSTHHAYLTDFGLTKALGTSGLTEAGQLVGTPGYLAPEQIQGKPIDHRVDVYSLGCVLYDCLTGTVPFPRETAIASLFAHLTEPPPRPSEARGDVPEAFDAVIATALAKDPAERYERAGLLGEAALAAVGGSAGSKALAAALGAAAAGAAAGSAGGEPGDAAAVAGAAAVGALAAGAGGGPGDAAGAPPTVIADSDAALPTTLIASVAAAAGPGTPSGPVPDAPGGSGSAAPPPPPAAPGRVTPPPGLASAGVLAAAGGPTILESGPPAIPPKPPGPPGGGPPNVPPGGDGRRGRRVGMLAAVGSIVAVLAIGGVAFGMASGALRFGPAAESTATPPPTGRTGEVGSPSPGDPPTATPGASPSPSPTLSPSPSTSPGPTVGPTAAPTPGPTRTPPPPPPAPVPAAKDTLPPSGGDIVLAGGKGVTTSTNVNVKIQPRPADPSKVTWYAISNKNQRPAARKAFDASFTWPLVAGTAGQRTVYVWFADSRLNWTRTPVTDTITFDHAPKDSSFEWDLRNDSEFCQVWIDLTMPGHAVTDADGNGTLHIVRAWGDAGDYELRAGNTVVRVYNPAKPFGELSYYFNYIAEDNHGVRVTARAHYKVGPCS